MISLSCLALAALLVALAPAPSLSAADEPVPLDPPAPPVQPEAPSPAPPVDVERLRKRAEKWCAAMTARDFGETFPLASKAIRLCFTRETWIREWESAGKGRPTSCELGAISRLESERPVDVPSPCEGSGVTADDVATVAMAYDLRFRDGRTERIDDMVMLWVHVKDDWYWQDWRSESMD